MLADFSTPRPLKDYLDKSKQEMSSTLEMLVWLLRKDYFSQLHEYIYLLPHAMINRERSLSRSFSKATDSELEAIDELTHGKPANAANHFRRLYPYFNGAYSKEEIMWRETISRPELKEVLDIFAKELVICLHE